MLTVTRSVVTPWTSGSDRHVFYFHSMRSQCRLQHKMRLSRNAQIKPNFLQRLAFILAVSVVPLCSASATSTCRRIHFILDSLPQQCPTVLSLRNASLASGHYCLSSRRLIGRNLASRQNHSRPYSAALFRGHGAVIIGLPGCNTFNPLIRHFDSNNRRNLPFI